MGLLHHQVNLKNYSIYTNNASWTTPFHGVKSSVSLRCCHCVWGLHWFSSSSPGTLCTWNSTFQGHQTQKWAGHHLPQEDSRSPNLLASLHLSSTDCSSIPVKKLLYSHCVLSGLGSSQKRSTLTIKVQNYIGRATMFPYTGYFTCMYALSFVIPALVNTWNPQILPPAPILCS